MKKTIIKQVILPFVQIIKITTTFSQKQRGELCDVYRWGTSLSHAYLNNIDECEQHISRWVEMWKRIGELFLLLGNKELSGEAETEIYETFKIQ